MQRKAYSISAALVRKWTNLWNADQNKFIVPYYYPDGYEDEVFGEHTGAMSIEGIDANVAHFERLTCVKMKRISEAEKDDYESVVRVNWDNKDDACSSGIGRWVHADNRLNMRPDCYTWNSGTTVNHEFMHTLGFLHEHQRADRDDWVIIHPDLEGTSNYGKLSFPEWEDLGSPYDFNSILHYYAGRLPDGRPTIGMRTSPMTPAAVDRHWPMSAEDAFQLSAYHGCEMRNKCAEAGTMRCGGPEHRCQNEPIGYSCVCAEGYETVIVDEVEVCVDIDECAAVVNPCDGAECHNHEGGFSCGEPVKEVHEAVLMIDGTGSYASYRADACQALEDMIKKMKDYHAENGETYRIGVSLYSDRYFNYADEFTRTTPRHFHISMPITDTLGMTDDDITYAHNQCLLGLGNMWNGWDAREDVLSGLMWTRSAREMNWLENSTKSIIIATDVGFWTKEMYGTRTGQGTQGPNVPPTSLSSPDYPTLHDLFIYGKNPNQDGGMYSYYPEAPAAQFILDPSSEFAIDHLFVSVKSGYWATQTDAVNQYLGLLDHVSRTTGVDVFMSSSIPEQFQHIVLGLKDFLDTAATSSAAIDECALGTDDCHADASCSDTHEGYSCSCNEGYNGNGFSCTIVDPCESLSCDGARQFCAFGACACEAGYEMSDGSCVDVNECAIIADSASVTSLGDTILVPCAAGATCNNTDGSYECDCDGEGWEEIDGICVNEKAWKQVQTQYTIRMHKVNSHLARLLENLPTTRFTRNYIRKMIAKIQELDDSTNEDKYLCDGSDQPDVGDDLMVFDGETDCKLASQIKSSLVSASRKWACARGSSDRLVRHFTKYHRQFKNRMCADE
ncbi:unnamed protein product [Oikopleura dioica]|uniref:Metalloendopeptidase n=1 Tax=Oikopleura dioica TaxID=34765 RepID=E4YP80_OIKDI|nr:unnamed protein product [Oikopleura dioica]